MLQLKTPHNKEIVQAPGYLSFKDISALIFFDTKVLSFINCRKNYTTT